jgi:hypothetical protein
VSDLTVGKLTHQLSDLIADVRGRRWPTLTCLSIPQKSRRPCMAWQQAARKHASRRLAVGIAPGVF